MNKKTPSFVTSDYNMNEVRISPFNQNLAELLINSLVAQEEGIRQRAIKMELNSPSKIGFLAPLGINPKKHSSCKKHYY
ncbi:MAG: hypothetical protein HUU56_05945 [Bdellovibrionaceae bacterium]|nr:hypothetical protein [Pseudobdellovibrionaceae bacterium]